MNDTSGKRIFRGRVLAIAGSDPSGGAGIQADIKAVTMTGGYAMTAITALTIQNTTGVLGVVPMDMKTVTAQMRACLTDIGADCIKTGMLGTASLIESIGEMLDEHAGGAFRVIDPVMVATSGDRLLPRGAVDALKSVLLDEADLVTPNTHEAEILSGRAVETIDGQRRAAERILEAGARAVLVKGGHIEGDRIIDVLQTHTGERFFESERIYTDSTHGTGCTLASAIASYLAQDEDLETAIEKARDYLLGALRHAPGLGAGHGPLDHGWPLRGLGELS